ncbi:MAG: TonB-dependent receptor [Alphaproteobacteria bacterium]
MVQYTSRSRKFATAAFAGIFAGTITFTAALAQEATNTEESNLDWLDDGGAPAATEAQAEAPATTEEADAIIENADAPPAPPASTGPRLDEIIVTAQKRAENVQDVPISVTAIGGETIKDNNISNLNDLSLYTPNVKLQAVAPFGRINMRGLGSGTNRGFEQSVGLVIDGVFFARLQYLLDAMLDLERVEALRGPQGTLFGKNTIAGALNIASGTPEPDFRAEGDITVGEQEKNRMRAMATGPIDKNGDLMFRLAATRDRKDGHTENTFLNRDESNTQNDAVRAKLRWEPTPDVDLTGVAT